MIDTTQIGGLFTLFLTDPLRAFAFISDITQIDTDTWENLGTKCEQIETMILQLLSNNQQLDPSYKKFIQDEFLALYCARFILMSVLLENHVAFKDTKVIYIDRISLELIHHCLHSKNEVLKQT